MCIDLKLKQRQMLTHVGSFVSVYKMLCNYKSCSSVPQIKAAGGRSIPSFIEHCTHPCTGHVEYLYNSVSSATRATTKEKETKQNQKKTSPSSVIRLQRRRSAVAFKKLPSLQPGDATDEMKTEPCVL